MSTYQRGPSYETKFMVKGKRYVGTFQTREEGEAWELEARAALKLGKPVPDPTERAQSRKAGKIHTIKDLVDHVNKIRWSTMKGAFASYRNAYLYRDWVGPNASVADALTPEKVDEYVIYRGETLGNGTSTINRHLSALSVLIKQAHKMRLIPAKFELPWQQEGAHRLRFFTEAEEAEILSMLEYWTLMEYRDLFVFLCDTGARLGEALKLEWRDVRKNAITFEDTKNHQPRTVYATQRVAEVLERRRAAGGDARGPFTHLKPHLIRHVWGRLRAHLKWLGPDAVVHTWRHTCASRLVQRGVDLYRVMRWMGHKTIQTTMRYAKLRPSDMEALTSVLEETEECPKKPLPPPPSSPLSGSARGYDRGTLGAFGFSSGSSEGLSP